MKLVIVESPYADRGVSRGMQYGISAALSAGKPVKYRYLDPQKESLP